MEENVALDTTKQKKFVKSIRGIKKLIKKQENEKPEEAVSPKAKDGKEKVKRKRPERGLVYLSHIPHGFYEHEMSQYFKQFGVVTNVRVIRSKRTGNSKGFAFVEFREPAVAEIVAETMNNYLMGKRLIKAAYVPPEKQRPKAMRKHWSRLYNPGTDARLKSKKAYNENKDDEGELKRARKILSNFNKNKKKLSELGINYDFFTPVDVPEGLLNSLITKEEQEIKNVTKEEKKSKKITNVQKTENKDTKESLIEEDKIKPEKNKKAKNPEVKREITVNDNQKKSDVKKEKIKKTEEEPVVNKKEQKKKHQKLKKAGVKPPENFIKVQEDSEDSDSSLEFDSDQYEKMLEDEGSDTDLSDDDIEGDNDEEDDDISEEGDSEADEEIAPPAKKSKSKPLPAVVQMPKQAKKQKTKALEQVKRKAPQKPPVATKKPNFEKQTQQRMKKQMKKKK